MPKTNRRRRTNQEQFNSTLPVWIVADGAKPGTLYIQCPRCKGKAVVSERAWIDQPAVKTGPFLGRACTYCFATSRLPLKRMNKETKRAYSKTES